MIALPISARLLLSYLLVAMLPLSGLSLFYLAEFESSLRTTVLENMANIADKKSDEIDDYIFERLSEAIHISQKQSIIDELKILGQAFRQGGLNTPAYRALERQFRAMLSRNFPEAYQYYDFMLMDAAGNVVFTLAREPDLGTNLKRGPYRDTQLAEGFNLVTQTLQARLTRFAPYAPSGNRAAAFLTTPMLQNGSVIGALALQMDISKLDAVVSDRVGLGNTGETVLAQQDGDSAFYTAPLRHIPDARFHYRLPLTNAALPMQQALSGAHERGRIVDYAGFDCVAAWRYLPSLRWGMVVKIDTAEAMAPATRLRHITYLALTLFLLLSGAAAYFLGRRLSRPITALTQVAERITQGDLAQRAPQGGSDELGRLGAAFNHMTDALSDAQHNLENKVAARTAELNTTNLRLGKVATDLTQTQTSMKLYASVFEHSGEAIIITDAANNIVATNRAFNLLTGYSHEEVVGKNPSLLSSGKTKKEVYAKMWADLNSKGFWQGELWDRHKDGHNYPKWLAITAVRNDKNELLNYIANFSDITEHKAAADKISYLAYHDTLTDLPNRLTLIERLTQAFGSAQRNHEKVAVMFIDLDRFKIINDTLGHQIGDQLLIQVAQRLQACVRSSDIVARLGGDEFVVCLPELEGTESVFQMADKILRTLGEAYSIEGNKLHSSPSIGIALFPGDGASVEEVMKNADVAMYHAKSRGRNNYQFFEAAMNQASLQRLELENDMRSALECEEFVLHYQPKINIASGRVSGVEALVRWQHPTKGLIPPAMFIPIAEDSGLMLPLGEWVMRTACRQLRLWFLQGMTDIQMSINISARQFRQKNLAQIVADIITAENIDPALLEFEITESMAMDNPHETIAAMTTLRGLGVKLAIDDFGTGYSSLSYLKRFPMNTLKLDRSFVKDIETDPSDAAICLATIGLAHNLGLDVVAEGVETEKQFGYLKKLGCDKIQGYYFSRPLPVAEAQAYIMASNASKLFHEPSILPAHILIIDDNVLIGDFLRHTLEYLGHKPTAMTDPLAGLEKLRADPEFFGLIMVDMLMPNMSGVDLVQAIRVENRDVSIVAVTSLKTEAVRNALRALEKECNLLYGINYFILEKPLTIEGMAELTSKIFA